MNEPSTTLSPTLPLMSPAIDTEKLLESCMGQPVFAMSLLQEFAETADGCLADFEIHSVRGDRQAVYESAHTLRGVAGIIGATALHEMSIDLEIACRTPEAELASVLRSLYSEIQYVQQTIRHACARF